MDKSTARDKAIEAAKAYRDKYGLSPVPLYGITKSDYKEQKRPAVKGWPEFQLDVAKWPAAACAIGVICGERSSGLFVLDFESAESYEKCKEIFEPFLSSEKCWLSPTRRGFHVWMWSEHPVMPMGGKDMTQGLAFEIRGQGHQIVSPPTFMKDGDWTLQRAFDKRSPARPPALSMPETESVIRSILIALNHEHAKSYRLESEKGKTVHKFSDDAPVQKYFDKLAPKSPASSTAEDTPEKLIETLTHRWPTTGSRHAMILALAGFLYRLGIPCDKSVAIVESATREVMARGTDPTLDDEKIRDLIKAVTATYDRADDHNLTGLPQLRKIFTSLLGPEEGAKAATEISTAVNEVAPCRSDYFVSGESICWNKNGRDGLRAICLANFRARIVSDIVEDDGADEKRVFAIEAVLHGRTHRITVPASKFAAMNWPTECIGAGAILAPGQGHKDHARAAIQSLSSDITERHIYRHTGWRKIGNEWTYLHAGGGIGAAGATENVEVSLDGKFAAYRLPSFSATPNAIESVMELLSLAPDRIMLPSLAAVFRAPLAEALPCSFSLFFAGATGVFKSELAGLIQGFFGAEFSGTNLPASWKDTTNRIERAAFHAKDALFCIDDFAPSGSTQDIAKYHKDADLIFRGAGNRAGRGRLASDTSERPTYFARALILSTGEDVPRAKSLRGRLLILEIGEGDIDMGRLTKAQSQRDAGAYASVMSGYIRWLASRMDSLKLELPPLQIKLREEAGQHLSHRRTPDIIAHLLVGWKTFLDYAADTGITIAPNMWDRARIAFAEIADAQFKWILSEDPAERFLALVGAILISGRCHVVGENGAPPFNAEAWGWRAGNPMGDRIGWICDDGLYLQPEASFAAVQRMSRDEGCPLAVSQLMVKKALHDKGVLVRRDESRDTYTVRRRLGGASRDVLHLTPDALGKEESQTNVGNVGKRETSPLLENVNDLFTIGAIEDHTHPEYTLEKPDISDTEAASASHTARYVDERRAAVRVLPS